MFRAKNCEVVDEHDQHGGGGGGLSSSPSNGEALRREHLPTFYAGVAQFLLSLKVVVVINVIWPSRTVWLTGLLKQRRRRQRQHLDHILCIFPGDIFTVFHFGLCRQRRMTILGSISTFSTVRSFISRSSLTFSNVMLSKEREWRLKCTSRFVL